MKRFLTLLILLPTLAIGATNTITRWVAVNTNDVIQSHTNLTLNGIISAGSFSGSGSALTGLSAAALSSGTVPLARMSGITSNQMDPATDAAYRSGSAPAPTNVVASTGGTYTASGFISGSTGQRFEFLGKAASGVDGARVEVGGHRTDDGGNIVMETGGSTAGEGGSMTIRTHGGVDGTGGNMSIDSDGAISMHGSNGVRVVGDLFADGAGVTNIPGSHILPGTAVSALARLSATSLVAGVANGEAETRSLDWTGSGDPVGALRLSSWSATITSQVIIAPSWGSGRLRQWDGDLMVASTGTVDGMTFLQFRDLAGALAINGSAVSQLNASALSSGTVPAARLSSITSNQMDAATDAAYRSGTAAPIRIALIPSAATSGYGSTNDATLLSRAGTNASWVELQFGASNVQRARWPIPAAQTMALAGGSGITCRVTWYAPATGAAVWAISMRTCDPSATIDTAYSTPRLLTNSASTTVNGVTIGEWSFVPSTNEITAGQMTLLQLQRQRTNAADSLSTNANVLGVSLWQ